MANISEIEIFSCLVENFRLSAEHCDLLAISLKRGPIYRLLMEELKTCETCCRQVGWNRGDARWLQIGLKMEEAHQRAGTWLRKYVGPGRDRKIAHDLFKNLAENLRVGQAEAEKMRMAATYRIGPILPKPLDPPLRDTRPVHVTRPSGLIVPYG